MRWKCSTFQKTYKYPNVMLISVNLIAIAAGLPVNLVPDKQHGCLSSECSGYEHSNLSYIYRRCDLYAHNRWSCFLINVWLNTLINVHYNISSICQRRPNLHTWQWYLVTGPGWHWQWQCQCHCQWHCHPLAVPPLPGQGPARGPVTSGTVSVGCACGTYPGTLIRLTLIGQP